MCFAIAYVANETCRDSGHNGKSRNVPGYYGACSDHGLLANGYSGQNRRIAPNRTAAADSGFYGSPVRGSLQRTILIYRTRIHIVREHDSMSHEDSVLYRDSRADESMARYFAVAADLGAALHFDKRPDVCVGTDSASVEIYEFRVMYDNITPQFHVRRNHLGITQTSRTVTELE